MKINNKYNKSYLDVYFKTLRNNLNKKGFSWLLKRICIRVIQESAWVVFLPVAIVLHLSNYRRLPIRVEHIGHLATEIDTFLKAYQLHLLPKKKYFILAPLDQVANPHLLKYWRPHVMIISNRMACMFIAVLTKRYFMRDQILNYSVNHFGTQPIYEINSAWQDRLPLLTLSAEDNEWASQTLPALGLSDNQWFVCLHVREGGYLPDNEHIQSHRNASLENTFLAIDEIIKRGGKVIRMGDASMSPLAHMEGVIDYAHHPLKSDRMDVVLCAKARFFLGCTSGLAFLSSIFGVPIAHANMIPLETLGIRHTDISIPKRLFKISTGEFIRFEKILSSDIGGYFYSDQYKNADVGFEENSADEIWAMIVEMFDRLEGKSLHNENNNLHDQYLSLMKPGHYSYGAASRISTHFLQKHKYLLV